VMKREDIEQMQRRVGVDDDGFWGPKSMAAGRNYLRSLDVSGSNWPGTSQRELQDFYGSPGDESKLVNLPVKDLSIKYDGAKVKAVRCHDKVADSLRLILSELSDSHPEIAALYAGCYNMRKMRGGSLPSLHARGAAIDFDPARNGNLTSWPHKATMPLEVMVIFARRGWVSAGMFWGRDAMHFQATK
jgi:D-alanyl-D-alanine carboxypeptidase